jgi:hypothetical protein
VSSYPITYGPYGPPANDPWQILLRDRARQVAGSRPKGVSQPKKPKVPTARPQGVSAEEWARQQAERYIQSRIDAINQDRELYLQDLRQQSDLEMERGAELARALEQLNLSGKVQGIFQNAGADIAGYAQGFSGGVRETAAADAAQQQRMLSGTGQEGAVRNQGENMGNVLYGLGGYIPGNSLATQGANFAAQAALEPSFARRIGADKASTVYSEGLEGLNEFTRATNEARGEQFEVEQELLSGRRDEIESQTKLAQAQSKDTYNRLKSERDFLVKQAYLALASGDRKRSSEYLKLAKQKEARMTAQAQGVDLEGNVLPGYKRNPDGTVSKVSTATTPAQKAAEKAKTNRTKARAEREDEFRKARLDAIEEAKKLVIPATDLRDESRPSYQVAYQRLFNRYKDLLRFAGPGGQKKLRARIDQLIREALLENGWQAPAKAKKSRMPGLSGDSPLTR